MHMTTTQEYIERFRELDQKIAHYNDVLALANWDQMTMAARKGKGHMAKAIGTLSTEMFQLMVSDEMAECLKALSAEEVQTELDEVTRACVRVRKEVFEKSKKIPPALYKELVVHASNAGQIWEEAKQTNNFELYRPALEKMVELKRQVVDLLGYEGHPYNALLDEYEPGLTVEKLDEVFTGLRNATIDLLGRIRESKHQPNPAILGQSYPVEQQKAFCKFLLPKLGFDLEAGRLDISAHPFAQSVNTGDVRITTRYHEHNVRSSVFGTIHETGHALYEQGINPEFEGTGIREGASMGIHESQSRFLENIIGRSEEFWNCFYRDIQAHFPEQLKDVSVEEFYRAINQVEPSLIRVEADELTYNLHIMIRYEIEKGLIDGSIAVKDLPQIWNEKMQAYLGITPADDAEGVLQDIHWSFGGIGYFPSYTLGNLYAAQFFHTLKKEIPDYADHVAQGDLSVIREWLRERIHQYGKLYTPNELVLKVTGEELDAKYLVEYFEEKYGKVYGL
jgi:carboxypeptidase Taq